VPCTEGLGPVPAAVARISLRRSILGVYLDPPESAVVLCVDKRVRFGHWNARIQCCRWDFGYIEGVMRDHRRHGTTALFAELDTARGAMISQFYRFCLCFRSGASTI
jgi:hypothetical protein